MIKSEIERRNALNPNKRLLLVENGTGNNLVQLVKLPNGQEEQSTLIFDVTPESFAAHFNLSSTETINSRNPRKNGVTR